MANNHSQTRVAIVLVNWNGYDDTVRCLESLKRLDYPAYSVIVVDNSSSDDSEVRLRKNYPAHTILQSGSNLGFAGGCNVGIRRAVKQGADYVLLLNNDTEADPRVVSELVALMESDDRMGLAGGMIYFMAPRNRVWSYGGYFNVNTGWAKHYQNDAESQVPLKMPLFRYLPACLLLMRRQCIHETGLLSEEYFHLCEDVDYGIRAQKKGWTLGLTSKAVVWHKGSVSLGHTSPVYNYYEQRNRLRLVREYHVPGTPPVRRFYDFLIILARLLLCMVMVRKPGLLFQNVRLVSLGVYDFLKGKLGKRF